MALYDHILLATDFSEASAPALEAAVQLAPIFGAKLTVANAYGVSVTAPVMVPFDVAAAQRALHQSSVDQLKRLSDERLADLPNSEVVALADRGTAHTILDYAGEQDVDLIVVGSHGRSGARRWLLGSVAERVVRHSSCDVLVMASKAKGQGLFGKRILATTDMSETSFPALSTAHTLAQAFDAEVTLLHVYDAMLTMHPMDHMEAERSDEEAIEARAVRLAELRDSHMGGSARVSVEVVQGPEPGPAICRFAEEASHDLIVVAKHGRSAVERMLIGSVSEAVTRHAHRPVLVVARPPQE